MEFRKIDSMATSFRTFTNIKNAIFNAVNTDTVYAEDLNQITGAINDAESAIIEAQISIDSILNALYPVGSIYTNADNATNPATLLGFGTWETFGAGRVPVGFDTSQTEFNTAGKTGGAKTHTLTEAQLPSVSGSFVIHGQENGTLFAAKSGKATGTLFSGKYGNLNYYSGSQSYTNPGFAFGGGQAHNNLQPYVVVYMWRRTS